MISMPFVIRYQTPIISHCVINFTVEFLQFEPCAMSRYQNYFPLL